MATFRGKWLSNRRLERGHRVSNRIDITHPVVSPRGKILVSLCVNVHFYFYYYYYYYHHHTIRESARGYNNRGYRSSFILFHSKGRKCFVPSKIRAIFTESAYTLPPPRNIYRTCRICTPPERQTEQQPASQSFNAPATRFPFAGVHFSRRVNAIE